MKKTLLVLALAAGFSGVASAEYFNGPYVGLNTGLAMTEVEVSNESKTDNAMNLGLKAGYGALVGGNFYLGGEVELKNTIGKTNFSNGSIEAGLTSSISATPGFVLNKQTLVYGKLGLGRVDVKATNNSTGYSATDTVDFKNIGVGVNYLMSKNISVDADFTHYMFDDVTGFKFNSNALNVGVNYRF